MSRFSPEFAAKLRHRARQVGGKMKFGDTRRAFGAWVAQCQNMMVINPFGAHYNDHMKPHYAISSQDNTTETYCAPDSPQNFMMGVCAVPEATPPEAILMEEDSPFRLPPGRHIVPILFRCRRPPTVEEQAVIRVREVMRLINEGRIAIPDFPPAGLDRV